jgi:hypothetical protein
VSRFENAVTPRALYGLGEALTNTVIARHRRRKRHARRITIDLDVTEDATHGAQQLTFFNGFYGGWCYLPLMAFLTIDDEPRQYLVAAVLRPGNAATAVGAQGLLRRSFRKCGRLFPAPRPSRWMAVLPHRCSTNLEAAGVEYVVAMANNTSAAARCRCSPARAGGRLGPGPRIPLSGQRGRIRAAR